MCHYFLDTLSALSRYFITCGNRGCSDVFLGACCCYTSSYPTCLLYRARRAAKGYAITVACNDNYNNNFNRGPISQQSPARAVHTNKHQPAATRGKSPGSPLVLSSFFILFLLASGNLTFAVCVCVVYESFFFCFRQSNPPTMYILLLYSMSPARLVPIRQQVRYSREVIIADHPGWGFELRAPTTAAVAVVENTAVAGVPHAVIS